MTVTQKQCLLACLGYYPAEEIDGIWGPKSAQATEDFQRDWGMTADGIFGKGVEEKLREVIGAGKETQRPGQDWWQEITYFNREEFRCKCGGKYCGGFPAEMRKAVVLLADRARKHFGRPGIVVSGLRCRQHNANVGGVANSRHMSGEAVDLRIQGVAADALLAFVQGQPEVRYAYKINGTNVHFDVAQGT